MCDPRDCWPVGLEFGFDIRWLGNASVQSCFFCLDAREYLTPSSRFEKSTNLWLRLESVCVALATF